MFSLGFERHGTGWRLTKINIDLIAGDGFSRILSLERQIDDIYNGSGL